MWCGGGEVEVRRRSLEGVSVGEVVRLDQYIPLLQLDTVKSCFGCRGEWLVGGLMLISQLRQWKLEMQRKNLGAGHR